MGGGDDQRRLILLIWLSSFAPESKLIDLTTVRVAALPRSVRKFERTESVDIVGIAGGAEVVSSKAKLVVLGR